MLEGRQFCENCGTEVSETTNFCPSCGAAQRPSPEVPTGPPPTTPETGRIETPSAPGVPPPPEQQSRGRRWILLGCGGLFGLLVLMIGCAALIGSNQDAPVENKKEAGVEEVEQKEDPKEEPKEEDPNPNFRDGTHRVGTDIQPETYRTREGSSGCYYARLAGFSSQCLESCGFGFPTAWRASIVR